MVHKGLVCRECGDECFIDQNEVSHHASELTLNGVVYNKDTDHIAVPMDPAAEIRNPKPLAWPWSSPDGVTDDYEARLEELPCGCYSRIDGEKVLCALHLATLNVRDIHPTDFPNGAAP